MNESAEENLVRAGRVHTMELLARAFGHELNNHLQAILGYVEITQGLLPEDSLAHANLERVAGVSRQAADLVNRFRLFNDPNPGKQEPTDLARHIRENLPTLKRIAGEELELESPGEGNPCLAWTSRGQLLRLLTFLVCLGRRGLGGPGRLVLSWSDAPPGLALAGFPEVDTLQGKGEGTQELALLQAQVREMNGRLETKADAAGFRLHILLPAPGSGQ